MVIVAINKTRDTKLRYNDKIIGQLVQTNDKAPQIPVTFRHYQKQYFLL